MNQDFLNQISSHRNYVTFQKNYISQPQINDDPNELNALSELIQKKNRQIQLMKFAMCGILRTHRNDFIALKAFYHWRLRVFKIRSKRGMEGSYQAASPWTPCIACKVVLTAATVSAEKSYCCPCFDTLVTPLDPLFL